MSVHETARPIHLTERDRWLSECSCGWEQIARTEMEARLAWKNHKLAMDEKAGLALSNDRLRNEARDPDVASIEEAFLYIAPVHESVVRDARAALRRIVKEIDKWHRETLDWQQAKSEADSENDDLRGEVDRQLGRHLCYTSDSSRERFWRDVDAALSIPANTPENLNATDAVVEDA